MPKANAEERAGGPVGPVIRAFLRYRATLAARSGLDFDDLIQQAIGALEGDGGLVDR
ncbi:MAG: hypothetical protein H0X16_09820 [Chloroflexi bacterium]|nr:hypothetical protein [Chloroflexota bacterium]